jgi:hypothetical protein
MGMHGKQMVSSGDGGVIIMSGHSLAKYDKDLNLIKEVEVKGDQGERKEHGMMMDEDGDDDDDDMPAAPPAKP